jgi:hypothetical protein
MTSNTADAQNMLNVNFSGNLDPAAIANGATTFAAGKIQVRVTDNHDPGRPIQEAQVVAKDGSTTLDQRNTDVNGASTLEIDLSNESSQELFTPKAITVEASKNGFVQSTKTITVIAIATIDVRLVLAPQ